MNSHEDQPHREHLPGPSEPTVPEIELDENIVPRPEEEIADLLRAEPDAEDHSQLFGDPAPLIATLSRVKSFSTQNLPAALEITEPDLAKRLTPDEIRALYRDARALHVDGITVTQEPGRRSSHRPGGPLVSELITSDERWHIDTIKLGKDALWQVVIGLASVFTGQAFLSLGAGIAKVRSIAEKFTRLEPDEGDVAGTLVRLMKENGGPVPRERLEAAYRHDPDRDGPMADGSAPIDAPAVINRLIDKKVIAVAADGGLTIPF